MPYAQNGDTSLYYETQGEESAPTVAFVCGIFYAHWMWNWVRDHLRDNFEVIVWDNRGAGKSDVPEGPYTMSQMAGDLEAILDDLGRESVNVVGASMGGMIALQYGLSYDRADTLSLLCTSHGGSEAIPIPPETQKRMYDVPEDLDQREAIRYKMSPAMTDEFERENEQTIEQIVDWRLDTDAPPRAQQAQGEAVEQFDVSDQLQEIDVPTLILHGTADRVLPVENGRQLHRGVPDSELKLFEGGSHLFFIERSDEVAERLRQFLDKHAGT